jgi:hypothetical protein
MKPLYQHQDAYRSLFHYDLRNHLRWKCNQEFLPFDFMLPWVHRFMDKAPRHRYVFLDFDCTTPTP